MPGQQIQTEALVLTRKPPADRFQQLTVFSAQHGGLLCLRRLATKTTSTSAILDLFDETDLCLETSNEGRTWFIKEARAVRRHEAIGRSYDALRLASAFVTIIARNPVHEESRAGVYRLLQQTFAAFGSTSRPDLVYLKALYCFARDEGYPVKQEWWQGLTATARAAASEMLNQPVEGQAVAPAAVAHLTHRLEDYLRTHTEILLDFASPSPAS
jgi:recombinational DNA repair protein (RecF pathway)